MSRTTQTEPETLLFQDDGRIPNSRLPLLIYRDAVILNDTETDLAAAMEEQFASNQWTGSWRDGVYPYHHYHSTTHEVLGVYRGLATLKLGGSQGHEIDVLPGDVIVIPAGVGHMCVAHSSDFAVVGAYPNGRDRDLLTGEPRERPRALDNVKQVPTPEYDPVLGKEGGLVKVWEAVEKA